jgi:hypothetical protein
VAAVRPDARDPRLDFFRGCAMLIIYVAHIPWNAWAAYIPARFGPSDATEMFVFCSGFASAIAFGGTFRRAGFWLGALRILHRVWQVYWAHIGMFVVIAAVSAAATTLLTANYIDKLNLGYFFRETPTALVALLTLTYVPNYFDILPMYIGVLLMVPAAVALARMHPLLVPAASVALYLYTWTVGISLPAEPFSDRPWFFNPFGWQLVFFSGFALSSGWVRPPPPSRALAVACTVLVVVLVPLFHGPTWRGSATLTSIHEVVAPWAAKTDFGLLRWLHFLALAYLAVLALRGREHLLRGAWAAPILQVGQQSLAVFLFSMVLARIAGMVLDELGRVGWVFALVNVAGFALLIGCAYLVGWIKSSPWRRRPEPRPDEALRPSGADAGGHLGVPQAAE